MDENKFSWSPRDSEFPAWMANFTKFVEDNSAVLGFTAEELNWLKSHNAAASYADKVIEASRKRESEYVNLRNILYNGDPDNPALDLVKWIEATDIGEAPAEVSPNARSILKGMVKRVATNNNITQEQKRQAGVLSRERKKTNSIDVTPDLKVTVVNGQAVLDCPLLQFKGYTVFVEDDNASAISLGNSTSRKYTDTRPLPPGIQTQQRTYLIRYVGNKNVTVGNYSAKVTVAVIRII